MRLAQVRFGSYKFKKRGVSAFDGGDLYYLAVALSWPLFLATLVLVYVLANLAFAALFWMNPGSIAKVGSAGFLDAFFFSVETLATVGYGEIYPATLIGHFIAAVEISCGLAFTAILTGLTFVRFSRPRARLLFADYPVVATYKGRPTLMLRIGNGRASVLLNAAAKLNLMLSVRMAEGEVVRRAQELRLERAHLPAFPLAWTLMHALDERSPMQGFDSAQAIAAAAQLFVTIEAWDPTLAAVVYDIRTYAPEDIRFGMRYADAVTMDEGGALIADLTKIGALERDTGERPEQGWSEREEALE